jgi:hypothetical protein
MQFSLTDQQFITVKKAALDSGVSLRDFLRTAVFEKIVSDATKTPAELTAKKIQEK